MRVVVTGGSGFLGSHVVDILLARGDEVIVVDNLITGRRENVAQHDEDPAFTFVEHDISEPLYVAGPVDGVLHMASPASPKDFDTIPIKIMKVGALGTHNCLGLAKAKRARMVIASTSEVYGDPLEHPQAETYWGNVNPVGPRGCYDEAKRFAEAITMAYKGQHGVDVGIVRTFNTFGDRMRPDDGRVVSNFIVQALIGHPLTVYGDGSQTRSLCFVDDQARGYVAMLDHPGVTGPINIGQPGEQTILQLAELILAVTGSASPITFEPAKSDDPARREPDISRAATLLGWQPEVDLLDGLRRTVAWFRGHIDA